MYRIQPACQGTQEDGRPQAAYRGHRQEQSLEPADAFRSSGEDDRTPDTSVPSYGWKPSAGNRSQTSTRPPTREHGSKDSYKPPARHTDRTGYQSRQEDYRQPGKHDHVIVISWIITIVSSVAVLNTADTVSWTSPLMFLGILAMAVCTIAERKDRYVIMNFLNIIGIAINAVCFFFINSILSLVLSISLTVISIAMICNDEDTA